MHRLDLAAGFFPALGGASAQDETQGTPPQIKRFPELQIEVTLVGGGEEVGAVDKELEGGDFPGAFLRGLLRGVEDLEPAAARIFPWRG